MPELDRYIADTEVFECADGWLRGRAEFRDGSVVYYKVYLPRPTEDIEISREEWEAWRRRSDDLPTNTLPIPYQSGMDEEGGAMEKDLEVQYKWCNGHAVFADGDGICVERCWWKESLDGSRRWWECSIEVQMTVENAREFIKAIREDGSAKTPNLVGASLEFFQGDNGPTFEWYDGGVIIYYDESRGMASTMADDMERVLKHMGVERCRSTWAIPIWIPRGISGGSSDWPGGSCWSARLGDHGAVWQTSSVREGRTRRPSVCHGGGRRYTRTGR